MAAPQLSVGTDLVLVADVRESVEQFGERYLARVYSPSELATCTAADGSPDVTRLAARFAAKEAAIKALRLTGPVAHRDIVVERDESGIPGLSFGPTVTAHDVHRRVQQTSLSLTHHGDYAAAVVVALIDTTHRTGAGTP